MTDLDNLNKKQRQAKRRSAARNNSANWHIVAPESGAIKPRLRQHIRSLDYMAKSMLGVGGVVLEEVNFTAQIWKKPAYKLVRFNIQRDILPIGLEHEMWDLVKLTELFNDEDFWVWFNGQQPETTFVNENSDIDGSLLVILKFVPPAEY